MAGIYIHVPFCRQACRYCDFYFTVSLKYRDDYVDALLRELSSRAVELGQQEVSTVYLGGGTPSVLTATHLARIMNRLRQLYKVQAYAEVTLEANPDDLDDARLEMLRNQGFNRLSIGVQSFFSHHLELMRRSHNAEQASSAIKRAAEHGFENINMDLIYGLPGLTLEEWEENVRRTMDLPVQHISAYHLTYESGTVFDHWRKKGRIRELPEESSIKQYNMLRKITGEHGFEHYEISNFALPGYRSAHNSSYWSGAPYVGFGPSAHSYNGRERRWNVASLKQYIASAGTDLPGFEKETLTDRDRYHDYLITALRTSEGADLQKIRDLFGEAMVDELKKKAAPFIVSGELVIEGGGLRKLNGGQSEDTTASEQAMSEPERAGSMLKMTPGGWLRSDLVTEQLMLD